MLLSGDVPSLVTNGTAGLLGAVSFCMVRQKTVCIVEQSAVAGAKPYSLFGKLAP